jgi:hypothetical protein
MNPPTKRVLSIKGIRILIHKMDCAKQESYGAAMAHFGAKSAAPYKRGLYSFYSASYAP